MYVTGHMQCPLQRSHDTEKTQRKARGNPKTSSDTSRQYRKIVKVLLILIDFKFVANKSVTQKVKKF
jgi:hypothetical protein